LVDWFVITHRLQFYIFLYINIKFTGHSHSTEEVLRYFSDPPGQPVIEGYNPNGYAEAGESL
jgi:hypothetical protein